MYNKRTEMRRISIVVLVVLVWFISCDKSQNIESRNQSLSIEDRLVAVNSTEGEQEIEKIRDIAQAYYPDILILDLVKINFGIPGGENWLVRLRTSNGYYISLCLIDEDIIKKSYSLGPDFDFTKYSQYDIMKDIPGTSMGDNSASAYGDYNGDGIMELFQYVFGGNGRFIQIKGYDEKTDKIVYYSDSPFGIIDPENGPAPVEFMTYNGRYGFKVYIMGYSVWPDPPNPKNRKWFFYAWDEEQREYVNMGEVLER
jgi:hypothetical protein